MGKRDAVDDALNRLDRINSIGQSLDGGFRVEAREILNDLWERGRLFGMWEPPPYSDSSGPGEATEGPRETSKLTQATGRPNQPARGHGKPPEGPAHNHPFGLTKVADCPNCDVTASDDDDVWSELRGWWEQTAHDEIAGLIDKMVEYGGAHRATDLTEIGRAMVEAGVATGPLLTSGAIQDGWLQELGAYFYLRGKFARWGAAVKEGRPVSDDTLHDIAIYTRMVQRIRTTGGWPI